MLYISTLPSGLGHSSVTLFESTSGAIFDTGLGPRRKDLDNFSNKSQHWLII